MLGEKQIDEDLFQFDVIWAAAGTPNTVFAVTPDELARVSGGISANLKTEK